MSSSSGGDNNKPPDRKSQGLKLPVSSRQAKDGEWSMYSSKRGKSKKGSSPVSPTLKSIIDNTPRLNLHIDSSLDTDTNEVVMHEEINSIIKLVDNSKYTSLDTSTKDNVVAISNLVSENNSTNGNIINDSNLKSFPNSYVGPIYIIIDSTDINLHPGKLHPMKIGKLLHNSIKGITEIKSIGSRVRLSFDNISNANACLTSRVLSDLNLKASIPASLVYSFGVIRLDHSISESEFFEGLQSDVHVVSFRRISTRQNDGSLLPSKLVELKFLSSTLPTRLSVFKVYMTVSPSIRSPVQCLNCLRFGHTSRFCRSGPRCSHCADTTHNVQTCPTADSTAPCCFYCKGEHLSTSRECPEWNKQKKIKKIMAVENVSFSDAIFMVKNNIVSKIQSFSQVAANNVQHNPLPTQHNNSNSQTNTTPHINPSSFPSLPSENAGSSSNRKNKNHKKRQHSSSPPRSRLPINVYSSSSPNGAYLAYVESSSKSLPDQPPAAPTIAPLLSDVASTLSNHIYAAIANQQGSISSAMLSEIIESSLSNILSLPAQQLKRPNQ